MAFLKLKLPPLVMNEIENEQAVSDLAARLPGNGRDILQIAELKDAISTREFLFALKTNTNRAENVRPVPFPPEVFIGWLETESSTNRAIVRSGTWARATSPATLAGLLEETPFVMPAEPLNQLRALQAAFDESMSEMNNWTHQKADAFFYAQSSKLAQKFSSGQIDDVLIRARREIHEDYRQKRNAIELRVKPLSEQARALAAPIIQTAMTAVISRMAYLEVEERLTASHHQILWVPSHLWKHAAALVMRLNNPMLHQEIQPRSMLAGIVQF